MAKESVESLKKKAEELEADLLLAAFRLEQAKDGNIGCTCDSCRDAMRAAYKNFKERTGR